VESQPALGVRHFPPDVCVNEDGKPKVCFTVTFFLNENYLQFCRTCRRGFVCLFVCFESHEQFFSCLATVTTTGDRAANLDLCLALMVFSSKGHTYCDSGPPFLKSYPKDPWFSLLNAVLLANEQSLPILNVLGLTWPARAGLELTTYRFLSESITTRLRQVQMSHIVWYIF
jgi:hypothetical protein